MQIGDNSWGGPWEPSALPEPDFHPLGSWDTSGKQ